MSYQLYDAGGYIADLVTTAGLTELLGFLRDQEGSPLLKTLAETMSVPISNDLLEELTALPEPASASLRDTLIEFVRNIRKCEEIAIIGDGIGEAEE